MLRLAEWVSARAPEETIVVSHELERHYANRYEKKTTYIPNGVAPVNSRPPAMIKERFALDAGAYVLFVGRLVPEKAPDILIRAFAKLSTEKRLVIVGGSAYTDRYVDAVREAAAQDPRVILTGYLRGPVVEELYSNAALFVTPSSLEGLPLVLLEAAAYGIPIVASDIPPHREILAVNGMGHRFFPPGDDAALMEAMSRMLGNNTAARAGADAFRTRVLAGYSWESVVDRLEHAYESLLSS
jgi:glycosyltransferase involved in cell wall biosynthesis